MSDKHETDTESTALAVPPIPTTAGKRALEPILPQIMQGRATEVTDEQYLDIGEAMHAAVGAGIMTDEKSRSQFTKRMAVRAADALMDALMPRAVAKRDAKSAGQTARRK